MMEKKEVLYILGAVASIGALGFAYAKHSASVAASNQAAVDAAGSGMTSPAMNAVSYTPSSGGGYYAASSDTGIAGAGNYTSTPTVTDTGGSALSSLATLLTGAMSSQQAATQAQTQSQTDAQVLAQYGANAGPGTSVNLSHNGGGTIVSVSGPPTQAQQNDAFVKSLYSGVLGNANPDASGVTYWDTQYAAWQDQYGAAKATDLLGQSFQNAKPAATATPQQASVKPPTGSAAA